MAIRSNLNRTCDRTIRNAFKIRLEADCKVNPEVKIIEELGLTNGAARIDIAVICEMIHGYELKSDLDTLLRLPGQMRIYNSVLDRVTLVVGKNHLFEAINIIPEWWGIIIAKSESSDENKISFCVIREAEENPEQDSSKIASLLWRSEALKILEDVGHAKGLKSKTRSILYEKLAQVLDQNTLKMRVREFLFTREDWISARTHKLNDD